MADFFDKMIAGINKGVNSVSEGSKTILEKAKINSAISDAEKAKRQIAEQIGISLYSMYQNGQEFPEELHLLCQQMAGKEGEIEELRARLAALDIPKEVPPTVPQAPAQAPAGYCSDCGSPYGEGAKFCPRCGKAL